MKSKVKWLVLAMSLGATVWLVAQDSPPSQGGQPGGPGGPGGHRPPPPLIVQALDANHDGVIDADEIANAVEVLKALDRNGDGKLTPDEFMGPPPGRDGHRGPPPGGPGQPGQPPGNQ
jgi:hypothetical protein